MVAKKKTPPSSSDLASALAQTRAELGRLARAMLTDDSDASRELYDAEKRNEARLVALLDAARDAEEQARKDAEAARVAPLREEFERLEAKTRSAFLDTFLSERALPGLERFFRDMHELEAGIGAVIDEQKDAARRCGELAAQMGITWGMDRPFPEMGDIRHRGRAYLERALRDNSEFHGHMAHWFPCVPATRKD